MVSALRLRSRPVVPLPRLLAVALAAIGLLAGVLAMHATFAAHGVSHPLGAAAVPAAQPAEATAASSATDAVHSSVAADCGASCDPRCGVMAETCSLRSVPAPVALVASLPALPSRLPDSGPAALTMLPPPDLHRPSLTVLSISRT